MKSHSLQLCVLYLILCVLFKNYAHNMTSLAISGKLYECNLSNLHTVCLKPDFSIDNLKTKLNFFPKIMPSTTAWGDNIDDKMMDIYFRSTPLEIGQIYVYHIICVNRKQIRTVFRVYSGSDVCIIVCDSVVMVNNWYPKECVHYCNIQTLSFISIYPTSQLLAKILCEGARYNNDKQYLFFRFFV